MGSRPGSASAADPAHVVAANVFVQVGIHRVIGSSPDELPVLNYLLSRLLSCLSGHLLCHLLSFQLHHLLSHMSSHLLSHMLSPC